MLIAYFAHANGGSRSGVFQKIAGQVEQWRIQGHTVRAFVLTRDDAAEWQARLGDALVCRYGGVLIRMRSLSTLAQAIRRFDPSIVYMRRDLFYPQMLQLPAKAALVMEVNADDVTEYALGPRARAFYNARTRWVLLRRAKGMVFVTRELSVRPSFRAFGGSRAVISNGIDLSSYPVLPAPAGVNPRLAFIGSPGQPWHGIDKLVRLAEARSEWRFDIIGMRGETHDSPANMTWHGPLVRADAIAVLTRADVGVGTLALHRDGLDEACSLKVREYLALGLPVLYANRDADADGLAGLTLRIANTETNVIDELPRISEFVERARGLRVPRAIVAHIDVKEKERQRLSLFEEVLGA